MFALMNSISLNSKSDNSTSKMQQESENSNFTWDLKAEEGVTRKQ